MGTGRTLRKKPRTRPIKSEGDHRRRQKVQKARLAKLGVDVAVVTKMSPHKVREMLTHPARIKRPA